ncbi:MAG: hypothetical protein U1E29_18330 [Coriobacteriia bacterium]|nr:hypothetical protein [Coriobacteriia bacterium]
MNWLKSLDWANMARTLAQAAIVAIGYALPLLTPAWWVKVGVPPDTAAPVLGAMCLGLAMWWRQRYQTAFQRKT